MLLQTPECGEASKLLLFLESYGTQRSFDLAFKKCEPLFHVDEDECAVGLLRTGSEYVVCNSSPERAVLDRESCSCGKCKSGHLAMCGYELSGGGGQTVRRSGRRDSVTGRGVAVMLWRRGHLEAG